MPLMLLSVVLLWTLHAQPADAAALGWWLLLYAILATVAETGIAAAWHAQIRWFTAVRNSVSNRLWRGVAVPTLAVLAILLAAFPVYALQATSERLDGVMPEEVWSVVSFGVLFAALPMAIVITRIYTESPSDDMRQVLVEHRVYRADLFLRAQHAYARAAGLLPFSIWLPYMANELQVFLQSLPRQTGAAQPADGGGSGSD